MVLSAMRARNYTTRIAQTAMQTNYSTHNIANQFHYLIIQVSVSHDNLLNMLGG